MSEKWKHALDWLLLPIWTIICYWKITEVAGFTEKTMHFYMQITSVFAYISVLPVLVIAAFNKEKEAVAVYLAAILMLATTLVAATTWYYTRSQPSWKLFKDSGYHFCIILIRVSVARKISLPDRQKL